MEFLVEVEVRWPPDGPPEQREALVAAEAVRTAELAATGALRRVWRVPGRWKNVTLWEADDASALDSMLRSLPLFPWLDIHARPLAAHPNDPTTEKVSR